MNYTAEVTREGRWWMITVPGVGLTQARRLGEVEQMARELIAVTLDDAEPADVQVSILYTDVAGVPVSDYLATIAEEKAEAARLEADVAEKTKGLVDALVGAEVPIRDIGSMLGISYQRVHQLSNA